MFIGSAVVFNLLVSQAAYPQFETRDITLFYITAYNWAMPRAHSKCPAWERQWDAIVEYYNHETIGKVQWKEKKKKKQPSFTSAIIIRFVFLILLATHVHLTSAMHSSYQQLPAQQAENQVQNLSSKSPYSGRRLSQAKDCKGARRQAVKPHTSSTDLRRTQEAEPSTELKTSTPPVKSKRGYWPGDKFKWGFWAKGCG